MDPAPRLGCRAERRPNRHIVGGSVCRALRFLIIGRPSLDREGIEVRPLDLAGLMKCPQILRRGGHAPFDRILGWGRPQFE